MRLLVLLVLLSQVVETVVLSASAQDLYDVATLDEQEAGVLDEQEAETIDELQADTLREQEAATLDEPVIEHDARRLQDEVHVESPAPPVSAPAPAPSPELEPAPSPVPEPAPAPTPEPTPDPNIPPGMEEMELVAFRLEYADEYALMALMEWAYDWLAKDRGYEDGLLRVRDLPDFLHRALNPAEQDIEDEERALLKEASDTLREEQGLMDDGMRVHIGFLSRGGPARFVRQLAHEMHHQSRARRLQATTTDRIDL